MTSPAPTAAGGSRTLAYVVAGVVATIPGIFVFGELLGLYGAITLEVVLWIAGTLWLLRKRRVDPTWDRRPPTG